MLACDPGWVNHAGRSAAWCFSLFFSDLREDVVDEALQPHGTLVELAVGFRLGGAGAEVLVGDVECDQNGEAERVAGRRTVGGHVHLALNVGGQLGDVTLVQGAADWIPLARDLDCDHAGHCNPSIWQVLDAFELLEHAGDTRPDLVALVAQHDELAGGVVGVGRLDAELL